MRIVGACFLLMACDDRAKDPVGTEFWHATLDTSGPKLEFGFQLERNGIAWTAFLYNGEERIEVPHVDYDGNDLLLDMPHYESRIRASRSAYDLVGTWEKRRSATEVAQVPFRANYLGNGGTAENCALTVSLPEQLRVFGRWSVHFREDEQPAVAVIRETGGNGIEGTFLTATGDYRYLSGRVDDYVTLSCFDGAHAFLFRAKLQPDGTLAGDFWSGNWHHETWTAKRDDSAQLADPFAQTKWNGATKLADLVFPDLDGKKHSLGEFAGKGTLLVVFGSWCPNCNDEAKVLAELDAKYRERGLRILGLAFELTGEPARDAEQVRIFAKRHELALPFFLCGTADKDEATQALGLVDRVRAFPTTIFVGADGLPKAIHSGFAGPATGEEHHKLRRDFEARIEALLR